MGGLPEALRPHRGQGKLARLTYILAKYWQALEYDFAAKLPGTDVGELWRSRRWRKLLNLIDHLPQDTWYSHEVSQDVEHAMMLIQAQERAKRAGIAPPPAGPSMATYSPEVERLDRVIDAVNFGAHKVAGTNGYKGEAPKPQQRPTNAMEIARYRLKMEAHDRLRRRMLPHIYGDSEN